MVKVDRPTYWKIAEQYVPIPLALAESSGIPIKGRKSTTTKSLKTNYKDATPQVLLNTMPDMWVAECVIGEGMFMLTTTPLGSHRTFADYASFLCKRFLTPHLAKGATEIHLFDNPGRLAETPKHFKCQQWDSSVRVIVGHFCDEITESRIIPSKLREDIVTCRNCKRNLVSFALGCTCDDHTCSLHVRIPAFFPPAKTLYMYVHTLPATASVLPCSLQYHRITFQTSSPLLLAVLYFF